MVVEPRGAWEHSAYQSDNQFVLEVRPQKVDPNKLTQGPGYPGEKLSLNFQNIEVRALLQVIADFTNFNVVTSDTVTGNVTLRLKDVPWDQALDIILQAKGLGLRKTRQRDLDRAEGRAGRQGEDRARGQASRSPSSSRVRTQAFQLNYTKAEDVAKGADRPEHGRRAAAAAAATTSRILSPRGSVIFETRTNQLFVTDIPSKLEEIQALIAKIDIPVRQVLIEARIVEADDTFGRSLGVRARRRRPARHPRRHSGLQRRRQQPRRRRRQHERGRRRRPCRRPATSTVRRHRSSSTCRPRRRTASTRRRFALSLFSASANRFLNLEISALEADGKGKVVSSPRVITADQAEGADRAGRGSCRTRSATSSGATSVQFRKANLKLEVTPQITPEGNVILDVDVNKDSVGRATAAGFAINTKHVQDAGAGRERRHRRDRRHLRAERPRGRHQGAVPRRRARTSATCSRPARRRLAKTELLIFLTPKVVTDRTAAR